MRSAGARGARGARARAASACGGARATRVRAWARSCRSRAATTPIWTTVRGFLPFLCCVYEVQKSRARELVELSSILVFVILDMFPSTSCV